MRNDSEDVSEFPREFIRLRRVSLEIAHVLHRDLLVRPNEVDEVQGEHLGGLSLSEFSRKRAMRKTASVFSERW